MYKLITSFILVNIIIAIPLMAQEKMAEPESFLRGLKTMVFGAHQPRQEDQSDQLRPYDLAQAHNFFSKEPLILKACLIKGSPLDQRIPLSAIQMSNPEHVLNAYLNLDVGPKTFRFQIEEFFYGRRHYAVDWGVDNPLIVGTACLGGYFFQTPLTWLVSAASTTLGAVVGTAIGAAVGNPLGALISTAVGATVGVKAGVSNVFSYLQRVYNDCRSYCTWEKLCNQLGLATTLAEDLEMSHQELAMLHLTNNSFLLHTSVPGKFGQYKALKVRLKLMGEITK